MRWNPLFSLAALFAITTPSLATELQVDVTPTRSQADRMNLVMMAVNRLNWNAAQLTRPVRESAGQRVRFTLPSAVSLTMNGKPLPPPSGTRGRANPITLQFDAAGPGAFDANYRAFLQDVFGRAKATLDATFGSPSVGGTVFVRRFTAADGDRDFLAGGFYMPNNGNGEQEIRFPQYELAEAAAVNLLHCVMLAYLGPNRYPADAFNEGLVRAATMRVARTGGAMPATLIPEKIEEVLDSTYDVGPYYDWYNQKALGGPVFIAPNLKTAPLPVGGSYGGLYLFRYKMAGSAWIKVLAENPGFVAALNTAFYANPAAFQTPAALAALAQNTLNSLLGAGAKVEGLPFADWFRRQHILQMRLVPGTKLMVHPFAIIDNLGGNDFGVFAVETSLFETLSNGNENLLSGRAYPIFWDPDYNRIFTSAQEDRMDIAGAYGSVVPNFPSSISGGSPYRVVTDIPVAGQVARCVLPAGAIATAQNPAPRNVFGTVLGTISGVSYSVRILWSGSILTIPVTQGAFGTTLGNGFGGTQRVTFEVLQGTGGNATVVETRRVNKGPGSLAVDLRIGGEGEQDLGSVPKGVSMIGLGIDSFAHSVDDVLQIAPGQMLAARWNPSRVRYEIFPEMGGLHVGFGLFVRLNSSTPVKVAGRLSPRAPVCVHVLPGWNLISNPLLSSSSTSNVFVLVASDFPQSYADARGNSIGTEFFTFTPGANDPISGAPEGGAMSAGVSFQTGKGQFIRVFSPEGATLAFFPSAQPGQRPSAPKAPGGWELKLTLINSRWSSVGYIGQSPTATSVFDRREDALLPPSIGGMQVSVDGEAPLYRDLRRLGAASTYKVRLSGLVVGQRYDLYLTPSIGSPGKFRLRDPLMSVDRVFTKQGRYGFIARQTTHVIDVMAPVN